ncbi:acetyltransferase [Pseudidiomarina sp. 1ASP75-14]|uniref:acetyltransferase n=1 Tax=Pseudidiomarina terrestris TaxID=2820060 RepID=UPI002651FF04|nr:acetyltransferase [Pseudidiomarina sp. 1ASP75-14]MDN7136775.1 acetyltransferase [Pseudidiomarina sp. 1ASP75-14]
MIKRLAIIGASGHGKVIADIARSLGCETITFYDDRWKEIGELYGYPVLGNVASASQDATTNYDVSIVAIGNAKKRAAIQQRLASVSSALVHPSAVVSPSVRLGKGSIVMPNAVINADVVIGEGVIVNSGAVVEHDCLVGDYSHICPNATLAGGVRVGCFSWIGMGSSVIQLVKIGDDVTVGAGSVVIRNVGDKQTIVGSPAALIKR